eukprot:gene7847-8696_t
MMLFSLFFIIALSSIKIKVQAAFDSGEIGKFNIGELFAFYNFGKDACARANQFAVAKKDGSGECQWKIGDNFVKNDAKDKNDLPIEDYNQDCVFSCVPKPGSKMWHTEKIINRFLNNKGANRANYNLYTYLIPCTSCDSGSEVPGGKVESADLDEYKGVYYSYIPKTGKSSSVGTEVKNDALLGTGGLATIITKTKVDLKALKTDIEKGKKDKKSKDKIVEGIVGVYQKKAAESYFKQHP